MIRSVLHKVVIHYIIKSQFKIQLTFYFCLNYILLVFNYIYILSRDWEMIRYNLLLRSLSIIVTKTVH